jgi:tRNA threonylcarbamoyladenosine biosynthesis protein TsaB
MRVLAIETATEACSVALSLQGRLLCRHEEPGRGQATRVLVLVDVLLGEAGVRLRDLDAIAFGRGPGGFTGVRLAVGVAQGLAFGAGVPVLGVSTLQALGQRALALHASAGGVLVCSDARMGQVYTGAFRRGADGLALPAGPERVCDPEAVDLGDGAAAGWIGAGRGFAAHPALAERLTARLAAIEVDLLPDAAAVAALAVPRIAAGEAVPARDAAPVYLRDDVARPARPQLPPSSF